MVNVIAILLNLAATVWAYLRVFRGAGMVTFLVSAVLLHTIAVLFPAVGIGIGLSILALLIVIETRVTRQKIPYPGLEIFYEGGGIRRGLSPVEVSSLFQQPKEIQFLIAIIGMLDKGLIQIDQTLRVNVVDWLRLEESGLNPSGRSEYRLAKAFEKKIILHPYEDVLIELVQQNVGKELNSINIDLWIEVLNNIVAPKIKGYDLLKTKKYYGDFISHRFNFIWKTPEDKLSNLPWLVFRSGILNFETKKFVDELANIRPDWLPGDMNFMEFINSFLTKE